MDQMLLIAEVGKAESVRLHVEAVTRNERRKAMGRGSKLRRKRVFSQQLDLWGEPKMIPRWELIRTRKSGPTPKQRQGVADVFAWAAAGHRMTVGKGSGDRQIRRQVIREDGVTRHVAIREQDTEEWAERERARRARQRPPRPVKAAQTRSKKFMDLIGDGDVE